MSGLLIDKNLPVHYRYDSYPSKEGVTIKVSKFYPVRETSCFYLVVGQEQVITGTTRTYSENPKLRRVSKNAFTGYCAPTKERALESFKARQNSRVWHAQYSLAIANQALLVLDKIDPGDFDDLNVGVPEFFQDVNWY